MYEFEYNNKSYSVDENIMDTDITNGLRLEKVQELLARAMENNIPINTESARKLFDAEHRGKINQFFSNYHIKGTLKKIPTEFTQEAKEEVIRQFRNNERTHRVVPRIIDSIARIYDLYKQCELDTTKFAEQFNIQSVRTMLQAGIPEGQVVLLYMRYDPNTCNLIATQPDIAENICSLLIEGYKENNQSMLAGADWISEHLRTDKKIIKQVTKSSDRITINKESTVEAVTTKLSNLKALKEIEKIEKAYKKPKFKFKDCICELKDIEKIASHGDYLAYIMNGQDERQVRLGYDTHCCQKLYDAGESSMMHGLMNPKAGFWIIEDKNTGMIKAQAEVWEEDENTIVFDNMEFANDAEIELYKDIIKTWLQETSYPNAKMGTGYNELLYQSDFRSCNEVKPTVTPYEIYVISYENESEAPVFDSEEAAKIALDNGDVTYYDYVYCDSENSAVWLKENGNLEAYFTDRENESTEETTTSAETPQIPNEDIQLEVMRNCYLNTDSFASLRHLYNKAIYLNLYGVSIDDYHTYATNQPPVAQNDDELSDEFDEEADYEMDDEW